MDEPLSNLDAQLRVQTREELLKLQRRLRHDHDLRHPRSDRSDDHGPPHRRDARGEVQQVGKPQEVYDHPANTFVAAFLGSPRINLHTGSVGHDRRSSRFWTPTSVRLRSARRFRAMAALPARRFRSRAWRRDRRISRSCPPTTNRTGRHADGDRHCRHRRIDRLRSFCQHATIGALALMARYRVRAVISRPGRIVTLADQPDRAHLFGPDGVEPGDRGARAAIAPDLLTAINRRRPRSHP